MKKGRENSRLLPSFWISCVRVLRGPKVLSLPFSVDDYRRRFFVWPPARVTVPASSVIIYVYICISFSLSLSLSLPPPPLSVFPIFLPWNQTSCGGHVDSVSRQTCRWWHLTVSPSTTEHTIVAIHPPLFPSSSSPASHPSLTPPSPSLSFSRSRERVLAPANGETRLSVFRGEQGLGGRNDYLLTFTRATSYARKSSTAAWVLLS